MTNSILVVDDKPGIREFLRILLENEHYRVYEAKDGLEAVETLETSRIDLIITDQRMPNLSGLGLLERVMQSWPEIPVIVITAYSSSPEAVQAVKLGAVNYIRKPIEIEPLKASIREALCLVTAPGFQSLALQGQSARVRRCCRQLENTCAQGSALLLRSEAGLEATQVLHELKKRATDTEVRVVPEVDALNAAQQQQLLKRLLAESSTTVIYASAARSLRELVYDNAFSAELYARLSEAIVQLPALRDRPEDLCAIASRLLPQKKLSSAAQQKIERYPFPENLTEFRAVLRRADRLSGTANVITEDEIIFSDFAADDAIFCRRTALVHVERIEEIYELGYDAAVSQLERKILQAAVDQHPSLKSAAASLKLSFRAFRYKLKKWKIQKEN